MTKFNARTTCHPAGPEVRTSHDADGGEKEPKGDTSEHLSSPSEPESPEGGRSNVSGPQKGTSWDARGDRARAPRWEARVVAERLARSAQRVASLA